MPGKHHSVTTEESSWRPLAKLSGLVRHGSKGKGNRKTSETTDDKTSARWFKRQKITSTSDSDRPREFQPLEVDLNALHDLHIADGWLDTEERATAREKQKTISNQKTRTKTPISDMFASKLDLGLPLAGKSSIALSPPPQDENQRRPISMVESRDLTSVTCAPTWSDRETQATAHSILDRGRPVEPKHYVTALEDLQALTTPARPTTISSNFDFEPPKAINSVSRKPATVSELSSKASQRSGGLSSSVLTEQSGNVQNRPTLDVMPNHRHSIAVTPSPRGVMPTSMVLTPAPRSVSTTPLPKDRIQSWQKSITSAPSSSSALGFNSRPGTAASNAGVPPPSDIPARRTSTKGVGNRLAWIRELEAKKANSSNDVLGASRKKAAGSVSDKLAMFESKKEQLATPVARGPPLSRTNSTRSRMSWGAGPESASSVHGNSNSMATPRTSIDTARSSHRTSSVMDYYDEAFREKMESVVGGQPADKDTPASRRQSVTSRFVPVKTEKIEEKLPEVITPITINNTQTPEITKDESAEIVAPVTIATPETSEKIEDTLPSTETAVNIPVPEIPLKSSAQLASTDEASAISLPEMPMASKAEVPATDATNVIAKHEYFNANEEKSVTTDASLSIPLPGTPLDLPQPSQAELITSPTKSTLAKEEVFASDLAPETQKPELAAQPVQEESLAIDQLEVIPMSTEAETQEKI